MIAALIAFVTVLFCLGLARLAWRWWPNYLNPVVLGIISWIPALVMINFPQFFISPIYIHQNREFSPLVYLAMALGFIGFWAGCATVKSLSPRGTYDRSGPLKPLAIDRARLLLLYLIGAGIFIYGYLTSGLLDLSTMDEQQVAESRLALHLGPISFLNLFMDIGAIGFFALFLQQRRWLYSLPLLVALLLYSGTLQKSAIVWMLTAAIFVSALYPRAFYELFLRRIATRVILLVAGVGSVAILAATNTARGITASTLTLASSPLLEQFYIYSGATAIKNLSVTLEGYLPSEGPTLGAYLIRAILWNIVDRDMFDSGRYFEGVNAATYLNNAWIDFRWAGFLITPFLTGAAVMLYLRFAMSARLAGLVFGAIAVRAVIFSIGTDVIFEPVTWYLLILALAADFIVQRKTIATSLHVPVVQPRSRAPLFRPRA